jgi:hypothetical protein
MGSTWVLNACPNLYQTVVTDWIASEPCVTILFNSRASRVDTEDGSVTSVEITSADQVLKMEPRALIDATGTAEVVRLVDPSLVHDDPDRSAGGLIVRLRGVAPGATAFPSGLAIVRTLRAAVVTGDLPGGCNNAWVDSGVHEDEVYLKLAVPILVEGPQRLPRHETTASAKIAATAAVAFLKQFPGFAKARVDRIGAPGVRDGGRVCGEYTLTASDVRECRTFRDVACRCCWPIEYWDPDKGVALEYLPRGFYYEIPLRALRVRGFSNFWGVGKCLSADRLAHASARIAGSCWSMGEAAARAAVS